MAEPARFRGPTLGGYTGVKAGPGTGLLGHRRAFAVRPRCPPGLHLGANPIPYRGMADTLRGYGQACLGVCQGWAEVHQGGVYVYAQERGWRQGTSP